VLWPSTGKTVPVTVSGIIADAVSGVDARAATYAVTDEYGTVQPNGPVTVNTDGSYAVTIRLQASRKDNDTNGPQYVVIVTAQNAAGNRGSATTSVTVPHDLAH